jgi:hypothetical protein
LVSFKQCFKLTEEWGEVVKVRILPSLRCLSIDDGQAAGRDELALIVMQLLPTDACLFRHFRK